jgi:hypothetical protein
MCARISAIRRLTNLFVERLIADKDFALHVPFADVLTEENVATVSAPSLYPEYDHPPLAIQSHDRDMRLLTAWLSSSMGRVQ